MSPTSTPFLYKAAMPKFKSFFKITSKKKIKINKKRNDTNNDKNTQSFQCDTLERGKKFIMYEPKTLNNQSTFQKSKQQYWHLNKNNIFKTKEKIKNPSENRKLILTTKNVEKKVFPFNKYKISLKQNFYNIDYNHYFYNYPLIGQFSINNFFEKNNLFNDSQAIITIPSKSYKNVNTMPNKENNFSDLNYPNKKCYSPTTDKYKYNNFDDNGILDHKQFRIFFPRKQRKNKINLISDILNRTNNSSLNAYKKNIRFINHKKKSDVDNADKIIAIGSKGKKKNLHKKIQSFKENNQNILISKVSNNNNKFYNSFNRFKYINYENEIMKTDNKSYRVKNNQTCDKSSFSKKFIKKDKIMKNKILITSPNHNNIIKRKDLNEAFDNKFSNQSFRAKKDSLKMFNKFINKKVQYPLISRLKENYKKMNLKKELNSKFYNSFIRYKTIENQSQINNYNSQTEKINGIIYSSKYKNLFNIINENKIDKMKFIPTLDGTISKIKKRSSNVNIKKFNFIKSPLGKTLNNEKKISNNLKKKESKIIDRRLRNKNNIKIEIKNRINNKNSKQSTSKLSNTLLNLKSLLGKKKININTQNESIKYYNPLLTEKGKEKRLFSLTNSESLRKENKGVETNNEKNFKNEYMERSVKLTEYIISYYLKNKIYPQTNLNFYMIGRNIGQGGFGKVKLGLNILTGRVVAIKSVNKKSEKGVNDKLYMEKILYEIKLMKKLNHQNITKILETFEDDQFFFIIMEYINGGNLFSYVKKRKRINEKLAKSIFKQIILGIKHLQSRLIVHRDIKLENILIDKDNNIKLCDFGIGIILDSKDQILRNHCGTPMYIAPEILLSNREVGYKGFPVDIWSAGITLYIMLTGRVPFNADDEYKNDFNLEIKKDKYQNLIYEIIHKPPKEATNISIEAKDLLDRLLTKDPNKRITCDEILDHPWLADIKGKKKHLFSKEEEKLLSRTYIDYRKCKPDEEILENFTLSNLFEDVNNDYNKKVNNCETKSSILTPFNSRSLNYDIDYDQKYLDDGLNDFNNKNLLLEEDIVFVPNKVKELNFQYEINNNKNMDNGVLLENNSLLDSSYSRYSTPKSYRIYLNGNFTKIETNYWWLEKLSDEKLEKILTQIELLGYDREYALKSIKNNYFNHVSTIFFLLTNYENL